MNKKRNLPDTFQVQTTLNTDETVYLYKLLFYLEGLMRNNSTTGFDINHKGIKRFLRETQIELDWKNPIQPHGTRDKLVFTNTSTVCYAFLKHIRNAFAHGTLTKDKNLFLITDKYRGKYTMYGTINPKKLFQLIDVMIKTRK